MKGSKMKLKWMIALGLSILCNGVFAAPSEVHLKNNHGEQDSLLKKNVWSALAVTDVNGLLGERLDLWQNVKVPWWLESEWMIAGFENRPGPHGYMGEHIGKWLHAYTLTHHRTRDTEVKNNLDNMVNRLLATQLENGYLGTYAEKQRFYKAPGANGWDIWVHRYNLYGLLIYERHFNKPEIITACTKMGDLLFDVYGPETENDITRYGTRHGMSSSCLLESMMMLYARTGDKKYLDFSIHIVDQCEANPGHKLMSTMLANGDIAVPGEGKAYQIMANFLGYILIYRATDDVRYLDAVTNAWNIIKEKHLLVCGGPWGVKVGDDISDECFRAPTHFHPEHAHVEGCSDASWVQMNIHLYELTGEKKYMDEAERCLFNDVLAHQARDGINFCYYTTPNAERPIYNAPRSCCASSLPRAMEMYANRMLGTSKGKLVINSLSPFTGSLGNSFGEGQIRVKSQFPYAQTATIQFSCNQEKKFDCEIRMPMNTTCKNLSLNGKKIAITLNEQGNPVISNTWKNGDVLTVEMEFHLKATITTGENGKSWVAFTYGPVALAQKLKQGAPREEPFLGNSTDPSILKGMLSKSADDGMAFSVKDSNVSLIPYVDAMIDNTTIVTYFKLD